MEQMLVIIFLVVIAFLLLREVNCWYWKINERVNLLSEIHYMLCKGKDDAKNNQSETL